MGTLAETAVLLGGVIALLHLPCVLAPGRAREWIRAFPRHRPAGIILAGLDLLWVGWIVAHASLGRFEHLRPLVYVLAPASIVLVAFFMDELLAARALGGLFLLVPLPVLAAARWHESPARLVVVVLAYVLVVSGIVLVLCPYELRKVTNSWVRSDLACRAWGLAGTVLGAAIVLLGLAVY